MKHLLNQIFVTLGVIFFILIIIATYFFITDPYNLKPLIFESDGVFNTQNANSDGSPENIIIQVTGLVGTHTAADFST